MGTRAVVRANLEPFNYGKDIFIATHWDGDPDYLGKSLEDAILRTVKERSPERISRDLGGILQEAVFKGAAEHHIDTVSTVGEEDFNERYGDWAEYVYKITEDGEVEWTEAPSGAWGGFPENARWQPVKGNKILKEITKAAKKDNKKKLKQII